MGIILLWVGIPVFGTLLALFISRMYARNLENYVNTKEDVKNTFLTLEISMSVFSFVALLCLIFSSISSALYLDNFYDTNAAVYEQAVEAIHTGVPPDVSKNLVEGPNLMQVDKYGQVVIDMRDAVVDYNGSLKSHLYWQDHFVTNWVYKNVSDSTTFINVEFN